MQKVKSPMKMNKTTITVIILIVWAVFSIVYMAVDYWKEFELKQMQVAFNNGSSQTVGSIIEQAKTCQPVNLYAGENQINLIDVACLQQQGDQAQGGEEMMEEEAEE